jgi:hypothetical protein
MTQISSTWEDIGEAHVLNTCSITEITKSITLSQLLESMQTRWPMLKITIVDLFRNSTVTSQTNFVLARLQLSPPLSRDPSPSPTVGSDDSIQSQHKLLGTGEVAIIGIGGQFPGASTPEELYQLFMDQQEAIAIVTGQEPDVLPFTDAIYVPKRGKIDGVDMFDPELWGLKEDEAR